MSTKLLSRPVLVRNTTQGPNVFHDSQSGSEVTWQGAGDVMGGDVQPVPVSFLESHDFLKALNKGSLIIEGGPDEVLEEISEYLKDPGLRAQAAANAQALAAQRSATLEHIENKANNDIVSVKCLGPSARGNGECGVEIPVRDIAQGEKPPLCNAHASLASQFIPVEGEKMVNGKPVTNWVRAGITDRQTYQPLS